MTPVTKPSITNVFEASEVAAASAKQSGSKGLRSFQVIFLDHAFNDVSRRLRRFSKVFQGLPKGVPDGFQGVSDGSKGFREVSEVPMGFRGLSRGHQGISKGLQGVSW